MTIAVSTSWNGRRLSTAKEILDEIGKLAVSTIELAYLLPAVVADVPDEIAERGLTVQSVHNPLPWPRSDGGKHVDGRLVDNLASTDPNLRREAVAATLKTIDLARALGAKALVVHLGHVEDTYSQDKLFDLLKAGRETEFRETVDRAVSDREARKKPHLEAAIASAKEIGLHARDAGISIGIETRDAYGQIPLRREYDDVFAATEGLPVYYWHDVGHAHKQELLGLASQTEYLTRLRARLLGAHLHDTIHDRDHYPPGRGTTDLALVARLMPPSALLTLELGGSPTVDEAKDGLTYLSRLGLS